MAAAAALPSMGGGGGLHFAIPEGTNSITGEQFDTKGGSWAGWGVDKTEVTSVTIPTSVTRIGENAFSGCSSLISLNIPTSVTSIDEFAFYGCSSLASVGIPMSVSSIGESTFRGCSSLTSVDIPTSVTSIGRDAFAYCISLTNVEVPASVTIIDESAFFICSSLTSVAIPTSVTRIGADAYYGCSSLIRVDIPTSVTRIGADVFNGCSSLTHVDIPTSVTSISDQAFCGCSSLASVGIPNSVTSIGEHAFYGCSSLASVDIPTSVTSIGARAFQGCSSLKTVLFQPGADDEAGAAVDSNPDAWGRLFAPFTNEDYDSDNPDYGEYNPKEHEQLLPENTKIWAPDNVIAQLTGQFKDCKRFADLPRARRAAPDAKTWAGVQLWLWWLPPTSFSRVGADAVSGSSSDGSNRVVCKSRVVTIWATMLAGYRAEKSATLPSLPEELWLYMFGFLKHEQQPAFF